MAIEAACVEMVWRRRLAAGRPHLEIEQALAGRRLTQLLSLALFDDESRGGEVPGKLNSWDRQFGDVYFSANKGAHGDTGQSLGVTVHNAERLADRILQL